MIILKMIIYILITMFQLFILQKFSNIFLKKKKINLLIIFIYVTYFLGQFIDCVSIQLPSYITIIVEIVLTFLVNLVAFEGSILKKGFFSISFNTIGMLIEIFWGYIFISLNISYREPQILGAIISEILFFLMIIYFNKVFNNINIKDLSTYYNIILLFIPIGSIVVINNTFHLSNEQNSINNSVWSLISVVIMLIINIIVFSVYTKLAEEIELKQYNALYEQQLNLVDIHMKEKEIAMMEFRNARHDFKQNFFTVLKMAEANKSDEIVNYLNEIIKHDKFETLEIANSGNTVIDSLINYKYSVANSEKIDFKIDLNIPTQFSIKSTDLCVIIGNSLDNAIEAAKNVKNQKKYIKFFMKYDRNNLTIVIINSFDGYLREEPAGILRTRKNDEENHGIGIHSIQKTVDKYHGSVFIQHTKNEFVLKLLLYAV